MKPYACLAALLFAFPAYAGKVIGIADGDTLTLLVAGRPLEIRLAGIDAPEYGQAFGERSKQSLAALCFGKTAQYQVRDVDQYGRTVAVVACAGTEANRYQVENGFAWVYRRHNRDASLLILEEEAREMQRGLWADDNPVPPWRFRYQARTQQPWPGMHGKA